MASPAGTPPKVGGTERSSLLDKPKVEKQPNAIVRAATGALSKFRNWTTKQ